MVDLSKKVMPIGKHIPLGEAADPSYKVYTCPELNDYVGRAGAMDAYRLPSLHMGRLVYPKRNMDNQGPF
jgi:hypothetical protein